MLTFILSLVGLEKGHPWPFLKSLCLPTHWEKDLHFDKRTFGIDKCLLLLSEMNGSLYVSASFEGEKQIGSFSSLCTANICITHYN
jgi:hypothetical protein